MLRVAAGSAFANYSWQCWEDHMGWRGSNFLPCAKQTSYPCYYCFRSPNFTLESSDQNLYLWAKKRYCIVLSVGCPVGGHTHTHTLNSHTQIHTITYNHTPAHTGTHRHTYSHTCTHIYSHTCTLMHTLNHTYAHIYTSHTQTQTHTHTDMTQLHNILTHTQVPTLTHRYTHTLTHTGPSHSRSCWTGRLRAILLSRGLVTMKICSSSLLTTQQSIHRDDFSLW